MVDDRIYVWQELGGYENKLIHLKNYSQRDISGQVWRNILASNREVQDKHPAVVSTMLITGGDRYCPIRDFWSCGFWREV